MKRADEVYYITPYIWNGRAKKIIADNSISKVDLTAAKHFDVFSSICYWNNHPTDKKKIITSKGDVEIDKLSDIEYLPFDIDNTLSIHRKCWAKGVMGITNKRGVEYTHTKPQQDEVYKYKIYGTSRYRIRYMDDKAMAKYGLALFRTPKVIIGHTRDNTPFYDRVGEYATDSHAFYITDNLDIRYKHLQSKLIKFYTETARQETKGVPVMYVYSRAMRVIPNIPLDITTDGEIYRYFALTDDEVDIVERYAKIGRESDNRRHKKNVK